MEIVSFKTDGGTIEITTSDGVQYFIGNKLSNRENKVYSLYPRHEDGDKFLLPKNKSSYDIVSGGTGYATTMTILHSKPLYVFEQSHDSDELLRKIVNALQKYKSDYYQPSIDYFVNTYLREQREINLNKLGI